MFNMNPMQMFSILKNKNVPDDLMSQVNDNPLFKRAQEMTSGKSNEQIMQICKNICSQKGIDFDQAFDMFNNMMNRR